MAEGTGALAPVHRRAWGTGLAICLAIPAAAGLLAGAGALPPGGSPVAGLAQQAGYSFTGLVFLAAAGMAWRRGRTLEAFARLPEGQVAVAMHREARVLAALSASSTLWGVLYWSLVGWNGVRHALTFLALTPVMFLCFMPGLSAWTRARKEVP